MPTEHPQHSCYDGYSYRDIADVHSRLLPPRQLCRHLLYDLNGVGDAVALALVDGVRAPAVAPLDVPALNAHGVTLLADVDAVVYYDRIMMHGYLSQGVGVILRHRHILRRGAARQQQAQQHGKDNGQQIPAYHGQVACRLCVAAVADGGRLRVVATVSVRLKIVAIVIGERASGVVNLAIVYSIEVLAFMVATLITIINSSLHIVIILMFRVFSSK